VTLEGSIEFFSSNRRNPEAWLYTNTFKLGGEGGGVLGLACTPWPQAAESGKQHPEETH